jgi:hypothetical protein
MLTKYYSGDQIKKNEKGGACSTYGEEKDSIRGFWRGNLFESYHFQHTGIDEG